MPFVVPETVKCGQCQKSVYAAEEVKACGGSFHKICFKCSDCKKPLDSTNVTAHQEKIYCKNCYAKNFGPGGFRGGSGGTAIHAVAENAPVPPVNAGNSSADALTQAGILAAQQAKAAEEQ